MPDLSRLARSASLLAGIVLLFTAASAAPRRADVPLSSLDLTRMKVQPGGGRGAAQTVAQANKSIDGNPIHIGGKEFTAGVGTRANSVLFVQLNGGAEHFSALVGADDNPIQAPPGATGQPSAPPPPAADADRLPRRGRWTGAPRQQARVAWRRAGAVRRRLAWH